MKKLFTFALIILGGFSRPAAVTRSWSGWLADATATNISGESVNSAQVSAIPSPTAPVSVSMSAIGSILALSWPTNHLGWRLQAQTNIAGGKIGTNWIDVVSSAYTSRITIPAAADNGSVFHRLVYP